MEHQHRRRALRPFVNVVHSQTANFHIARREWETGQIRKALIGRAQNIHQGSSQKKRYLGNLPRTLDRSERGAKAVETAMLRQCGIDRDKMPSLSASRKPVDDYFKGV